MVHSLKETLEQAKLMEKVSMRTVRSIIKEISLTSSKVKEN